MEIVHSNSENDDRLRRLNICKRKRTTFYKSKPSSSSNNKVISLRNSKSSNTKAAAGGNFSEAPPRAMGIDGHFYECMKCNKVGSLICCGTCACTYHYECLDPPLESVPEGDWFCHNCSKEADGNLSDSTVNVTGEGSSNRRRRSMKRACKVSSGCCLCSKIKKKIIPDENDFFSFRTKSKAHQSNLLDRRGRSSAPNDEDDDGGVGSAIIQRNTNNNVDKRLVLRPRKRAEGNNYQIQTRKTAVKRASSSSAQAAEKEQNVNNQPPRRRGRPRKYPQQIEQAPPQPQQQQQQKKKPGRALVVYGANLPAEYLEAMRAAEEARRNNAKEIPWAGVELDALWVGVRRHGADNWDTILGDPNLCILVLCKKTSLDLSSRWKKELEKMSSVLQASGYLLSPPPPPPPPPAADHELPVDDRPAISNGEATTAPQILPPQVTSTESGPLLPHRQGSSSSSASVPPAEPPPPPPPPPPRTEGEAAAQQVLPAPPQIPDSCTETGLVVPNNNQGSSSSCPMKSTEIGEGNSEEQLLTPLVVPPNEHQATSSPLIPVEASTSQQHFGVTSSESGGALVGTHSYYQQGASSSSSFPRASVTVAVASPTWRQNLRLRPPQWRPNLNLHPMANHLMFEAFQRRRANAAPPQTMMNHMAAPPAPRPPPNATTVRPNLYLGGFFPVRNPY